MSVTRRIQHLTAPHLTKDSVSILMVDIHVDVTLAINCSSGDSSVLSKNYAEVITML